MSRDPALAGYKFLFCITCNPATVILRYGVLCLAERPLHLHSSDGSRGLTMFSHAFNNTWSSPLSNQEPKVRSHAWEDIIFISHRSDLDHLWRDQVLYRIDTDPDTYYGNRPPTLNHSRWLCIRSLPFIIEHKFPGLRVAKRLLAMITTNEIRSCVAHWISKPQ